jgi:hypothetical protein
MFDNHLVSSKVLGEIEARGGLVTNACFSIFKDQKFRVSRAPIHSSLLKLKFSDSMEAVNVFKLVSFTLGLSINNA